MDGSSSDSAIVASCEGGSVSSNASKNASYNASSNTSPNPPINASNTTPINPPALSVATADRIAVLWEPSPTLTHRLTALHAPSLATDLLCSLDFRMPGAETPLLRTLRECDRTLRETSAPLPSRLLWVTVASLLALAHTTPLPPAPARARPPAFLSLLHTLLLRCNARSPLPTRRRPPPPSPARPPDPSRRPPPPPGYPSHPPPGGPGDAAPSRPAPRPPPPRPRLSPPGGTPPPGSHPGGRAAAAAAPTAPHAAAPGALRLRTGP